MRTDESVYEDAKAFNEYASAAVELSDAHLSDNGIWTAIRSTRDIDQAKRRRYLYTVALGDNSTLSLPPMELNDGILARIPSPSGRKVAIFREEVSKEAHKRQQVLEVWTDHGLVLSRRILLPAEQHRKPIFDAATFGGPSWNPDETALVYVAERLVPDTATFFDPPHYEEAVGSNGSSGMADENVGGGSTNRGFQNTLGYGVSETWGEKYPKQAPLLDLFLANVETGRVGKVENCPRTDNGDVTTIGSFALGQPQFEPTRGQTIVYTAYDAGGGPDMPRRLGLIYCQQRPSKLYASPVAKLLKQLATPSASPGESKGQEQSDESTGDSSGTEQVSDSSSSSDKDGACYCLTLESRLARSPVFSPVANGKSKLVYMSSKDGFDTHSGCFGLSVLDWKHGRPVTSSHRTLVQAVWDPNNSPPEYGTVLGMKFPGLFMQQLPTYCFVSPDYLVTNTHWGSTSKIVRISLSSGDIAPVQHSRSDDKATSDEGGSISAMQSDALLCVHPEKGVVGATSSPNKVPIIWHVPISQFLQDDDKVLLQSNQKKILESVSSPIAASKFSAVPESPKLDFQSDVRFLLDDDLPQVEGVQVEGVPVQTILLLPSRQTSEETTKPPLIVIPHGGPHSVSLTSFMHSTAFLCGYGGYAVALVNYRGSTGFGQGLVEALPGRIGDLDVKDVVASTQKIKESGLVDPNRIGICGGSHGGFLTGHLTGQYPDMFRAAVMRNPVVNLPSMSTATDIPDWVFVEGLGKYDWATYRPPMNTDEISELWNKSPIRHVSKVKTPTLVALGMQDLRVPPSQGLEWYHSLRARRSIATKLLMYEDNDHAIIGTAAEADHWVNIKRWFDEHL